ncbi:MAG: GNAT family N-acetyltransferase [Lachnospiraceae bacterium]|nr:GNAT family N-acetyltransferase [Lachnospiraceae bacterium]
MEITIRSAYENDAEELLKIYEPYILNTAITFEYTVPTVSEFRERVKNTLQRYPYLVAVGEGKILGYAYVSAFKERAAYDRSVETSIYVSQGSKHMGIGGKLHAALEEELKNRGFLNMYACIAYPEQDDEYLNKNSVEFHSHLGYRLVGEFYKCGYKFNRWYNMVWMEKLIGEHK